MRLTRLFAVLAFTAFVAPSAGQIEAQTLPRTKLFIQTGPDPFNMYSHLRYNGRDWKTMTALLQGTFDITFGAVLPLVMNLKGYDALWIDQRYGATPAVSNIESMMHFAATGKRVVIVGENSYSGDLNFYKWSSPFLKALGGVQGLGPASYGSGGGASTYASGAGCLYARLNPVLTHPLTNAVLKAEVGCAGFAIGGTPLFDYNTATLWGSTQNILTILDANLVDDYWGNQANSPQFRENLVEWLDGQDAAAAVTAVPEPATYAMMVPALLVIAGVVRRRRRIAEA